MPIRNFPFMRLNMLRQSRPALGLRFIRCDDNKKAFRTFGIVDTGAERCSLPFSYAIALGFKEEELGTPQDLGSAGGKILGYPCVINVEVYEANYSDSGVKRSSEGPQENTKKVYVLCEIPVYFIKSLNEVLIGNEGFLDQFILRINYPKQTFSLILKKSFLDFIKDFARRIASLIGIE